MPAKVDPLRIDNPFMDKRVKLLPCQKEAVIYWSQEKGLSQRKLAKMFKVSRRTIQFVLDDEKLKENLKRREERGGTKIYYDKDKHREAMQKHREHKKDILKSRER